ncbi:BES1 N domain-containing protein [Abeliophyllum distichum]|uniref:Protein BZR1 homolog n=1 Tax=Abeliophyllum distichum TaxID=126358 RepID=A0ABD1QJD1_9LAMI
MKEDGRVRNRGNVRSSLQKERTKMRERQMRSITAKIFHGLRQHGGYHLSPRADINQVLRHLAQEAGWVIGPDGTTYCSTSTSNSNSTFTTTTSGISVCPLCGGGRKGAIPMPKSSFMGANTAIGSGECSTTALPRRIIIGDPNVVHHSSCSLPFYGGCGQRSGSTTLAIPSTCSSHHHDDTLTAIYTCAAVPQKPSAAAATASVMYRE